ncbi:hypothetical protein ATE67_15605 [Sphingopyxis sp. H050]|jgi:hypothetical protein|nr:hypothetical protein ATE67_15605 [Sphingopyxis sp. H050]
MKMVMDLSAASPLRPSMDDDRRDLAIRLCTQIGMLMEDVSAVALECRGDEIALNTRRELSAHDPKLYRLIEDVFGPGG